MGQAIKTLLTDSINLMIQDVKSISTIRDLETKNRHEKDLKVLNNLHGEIEIMLHQLETSHDIWEDLKRFVRFIFWLENFQNEYRLKLTDEDKINRTFYVDNINRFFFHCMNHLHSFDYKLRMDLKSNEKSMERSVYLSLFLEEEISKQELCEYFKSFNINPQLFVSTIGDLIVDVSENQYWPKLRLDNMSRISNNFKREAIQIINNELSLRIAPKFENPSIINVSFLNFNTDITTHNHNQTNTINNLNKTIHHNVTNINHNTTNCQVDFENIIKENSITESKGTKTKKAKSNKLNPEINWTIIEKHFKEFFDLPILHGEKIPSNDIDILILNLQKCKNKSLIPESINNFFGNDFNKKLFRLYLWVITNPKYDSSVIPKTKHTDFMRRWDIVFGNGDLKTYTLIDFMGGKNSRKDKVENLSQYKDMHFDLRQKSHDLLNNEMSYKNITFQETRNFIEKIIELAK